MLDGSDAIADWPLLNALVNCASGATWVSIHHGGGVGIGRSIHAGQVTVADGTPLAAAKLERVLTNDPGMGIVRHVDAGYDARRGGRGGARRADPDAGGRLTRYWAEHAWLGGERAEAGVLIELDGDRIASRGAGPGRPARRRDRACAASRCRGSPTPTRTRSTARCAAARTAAAARSGPGARTCTRSRSGSTRTPTARSPAPPSPRWRWPASRAPASSTTSTTARAACPTRSRTRWATALIAAAAEAGIRITLLDTCYLAAGFGEPAAGPQLRFSDGDARGAGRRAPERCAAPRTRGSGPPLHSVRAVPADQLETVAGWARERGAPLHVHLSEQRAENEACLAAHGRTPAELLDEHGALGPASCAVHATHLTGGDVARLGAGGTAICMCATTERDLADGIGPARALADAGAPLCTGSDSHAVIDPFEEARAVELDERLRSERRGHLSAAGAAARRDRWRPRRARLARGRPDRAGGPRRPRHGLAGLRAARRRRARRRCSSRCCSRPPPRTCARCSSAAGASSPTAATSTLDVPAELRAAIGAALPGGVPAGAAP